MLPPPQRLCLVKVKKMLLHLHRGEHAKTGLVEGLRLLLAPIPYMQIIGGRGSARERAHQLYSLLNIKRVEHVYDVVIIP
jgi:hypothetical protein